MEIFGVFYVIGIVILAGFAIVLPFSVYAAQKWAYRSYKELEKINRKLDNYSSRD